MFAKITGFNTLKERNCDKNSRCIRIGTIGVFILMFLHEMEFENISVIGYKDFQKNTIMKNQISSEKLSGVLALITTKRRIAYTVPVFIELSPIIVYNNNT